jgi:CubicO group peptidase (beta-lactamase class C family)
MPEHSTDLSKRLTPAWELTTQWPAQLSGIAVVHRGEVATHGDTDRVFHLASVTKLLTAWAIHISCEEGSLHLEDSVGQSGCTVLHLLAHAGGYSFDGDQPIASPGARRIYSNTGYELLGQHLEQMTDISISDYVQEAVCEPLQMTSTQLRGSPAKDAWSNVHDLIAFATELQNPSLIAKETYIRAVTPAFPELAGMVPGFGKSNPSLWGLGPEIKGLKDPHWTAPHGATSTFGHFGSAGTFLWVDPVSDTAVVLLSQTPFDDWGTSHWPGFNQTVLDCLSR